MKIKEIYDVESGFGIHYFLSAFNDTFHKSGYQQFKDFFLKNKKVSKWMVFTDYAFYDKKKESDVVTFTFYPYVMDFHKLSSIINSLSNKDIKDTKKVNHNFLEFIESSQIFSISIILSRNRRLEYTNERKYFLITLEKSINQLDVWVKTTPENKEYYTEFKKKLIILKNLITNKGTNLKIIRDIEIISSIVAYLMFEVTNLIPINKIGWFSDRDQLLDYKKSKFNKPILFDFIQTLYYLFCKSNNILSENKLVLGIPEENGKVWYDTFNRIPDLICGTLSDYNIKEDKFSHEKFKPIFNQVILNNPKNLIFKINFSKNEFSAVLLNSINNS